MKYFPLKSILLFAVISISSCSFSQIKQASEGPMVLISTKYGDMKVVLYNETPLHRDNFMKLTKEGVFDSLLFHRVIKGFMIQGGDPNTKDAKKESQWGMGDPGYKVKAEFNDRHHDRGVLSMARSQDPDSAGSQFFICHGSPRFLDKQYTAFGKVIKGDDVLEKIATTATHPPDRPNTRMGVESVKIVAADTIK